MQHRRRFLKSLTAGTLAGFLPCPAGDLSSAERTRGTFHPIPTETQIRARSENFWKLVDLINAYRARYRLPRIGFSPKLTVVAALHAKDLAERRPHETHGSLHSWSPDDRWTGGAYKADDKSTWPLMWDKPKEITGYAGYGFEICAAKVRTLERTLPVWQTSQLHNNVLLNRGVWSNPRWRWQAVGAVFHEGFACAWFGDEPDE